MVVLDSHEFSQFTELGAEVQRLHEDTECRSEATAAGSPGETDASVAVPTCESAPAPARRWGSLKWGLLALAVVIVLGAILLVVLSPGPTAAPGRRIVSRGRRGISVPVWQVSVGFNYSSAVFDGAAAQWCDTSPSHLLAVNSGLDTSRGNYQLTSATVYDAVKHAVLNDFPFFGRVTSDHLAVFEGGHPQRLFGSFPIDVGGQTAPWSFRLFHLDWEGTLQSFDPRGGTTGAGLISFTAFRPDIVRTDERLVYDLDLGAGFVSSLQLFDAEGTLRRRITLGEHHSTTRYEQTYFVRASDLLDQRWNTSGASAVAELVVGAHKSGTAWSLLAYSVDASAGCATDETAAVSLAARNGGGDSSSLAGLNVTIGGCSDVCGRTGYLGGPLDSAYNYSVAVSPAQTLAARLRVAGGVLYTYRDGDVCVGLSCV
jgi:hypothetical protein